MAAPRTKTCSRVHLTAVVTTLALGATLAACEIVQQGDPSSTDEGGCSKDGFQDEVTAFCVAQFPPAPAPRTLGATCEADVDCDSGICDVYAERSTCAVSCAGEACPAGFRCDDSDGELCLPVEVHYAGGSKSECVTALLATLDGVCASECEPSKVRAWMDCLSGAAPMYDREQADDACGVELGLLQSCAPDSLVSNW